MSRGPLSRARRAARLVELIPRVARGDKHCFAELYDLTSPCVYAVALHLLQSTRLASAVTEEVYVEVWRLAPRYDPAESSVLAWVMALAHRRATAKAEALAERALPGRRADDRGPVGPDVDRARRALAALRDPHRQAVVLAYFGECNQLEVARILGLPVATVTTRIRIGLVGLRQELGVGA